MPWIGVKRSPVLHFISEGDDKLLLCGNNNLVPTKRKVRKCMHCLKVLEANKPPLENRIKKLEKDVRMLFQMVFKQ